MTLNKIGVILKSILTDLHARNFAHPKTYLHAHCMNACHHACNYRTLLSHEKQTK